MFFLAKDKVSDKALSFPTSACFVGKSRAKKLDSRMTSFHYLWVPPFPGTVNNTVVFDDTLTGIISLYLCALASYGLSLKIQYIPADLLIGSRKAGRFVYSQHRWISAANDQNRTRHSIALVPTYGDSRAHKVQLATRHHGF